MASTLSLSVAAVRNCLQPAAVGGGRKDSLRAPHYVGLHGVPVMRESAIAPGRPRQGGRQGTGPVRAEQKAAVKYEDPCQTDPTKCAADDTQALDEWNHSRSKFEDRKRTLREIPPTELKGTRVFVRCDLNVPLQDGQITDDTRIRASIPTIGHLRAAGARIVLASHLGRPKGGRDKKYSLKPVAERLSRLLGVAVQTADDCVGDKVHSQIKALKDGEILLLENVRFHKEEEKNDIVFSKKLAKGIDIYVNDAFGTAHRAHASTVGVATYVGQRLAGFLLEKELAYLQGAVDQPKKPFVAIVGGSKVSSKITVIESLMRKCDKIILGGGMVFTFFKSRGLKVGSSLVEEDKLELAEKLTSLAKELGVELLLPVDVIVADKFAADANSKVVKAKDIPDDWMGLDIGPESIKLFQEALKNSKTVIWNGPMGVFEFPKFAAGTTAIANTLADITKSGAITIIGGGDSVAAVEQAGVAGQVSHISTGGGASLELLEGKVLPGVAVLDAIQVHA